MNQLQRDKMIIQSLVETYGKSDVIKYVKDYKLNEDSTAVPQRNRSSVDSIIADAISSYAAQNDGVIRYTPSSYPKLYKALCNIVAKTVIRPDFVADKVRERLNSLNAVENFEAFISTPSVAKMLEDKGVAVNSYASSASDEPEDVSNVTTAKRGPRMLTSKDKEDIQKYFMQYFDITLEQGKNIDWNNPAVHDGVVDRLASDLVLRHPELLDNRAYTRLLDYNLIWVVRTHYKEDPVLFLVANDEYVDSCIDGTMKPLRIGDMMRMHGLQKLYWSYVYKSVSGLTGFYEARPCGIGTFISDPIPDSTSDDVVTDDLTVESVNEEVDDMYVDALKDSGSLYPEYLAYIVAVDAAAEYIKENGPISLYKVSHPLKRIYIEKMYVVKGRPNYYTTNYIDKIFEYADRNYITWPITTDEDHENYNPEHYNPLYNITSEDVLSYLREPDFYENAASDIYKKIHDYEHTYEPEGDEWRNEIYTE